MSIDNAALVNKTVFVSKKPKTPNRVGKKAAQFFISPLALVRFNAACALYDDDRNEAAERLFVIFADSRGIPSNPTEAQEPTPPASAKHSVIPHPRRSAKRR